ncbi:glycosyltransferase family 2 protein [Brevibacillus sp. 179-C9.3 HS]|uniref:glycosyltransferase family 2 protein n=1 Tax=unclassified Brevibacillus TaxID=2684853 RepID=UPI00399FFA42
MNPTFTVVIPTYNRAKFIRKAISSVLKQTSKDWKLLIIDDASTDKTRKKVEKYLFHPNIEYYRMEKNAGIGKVMNQALSMVDTPYLLQLDSDDWLPKRTLATINKYINKSRKSTALFYGNIKIWRVRKGRYYNPFLVKHKHFRNKYQFLKYNRWMVAPRCYRVEALRQVGGWDTSDKFGGRIMEDRRIILRLIEKFPVRFINQKLYHRTKHRGQLTDNKMKRRRNLLRKKTFKYYLKRWGKKYRAVYGYRDGYLIIRRLKKVRRRRR